MRLTAIYVHQPTTVRINTTLPADAGQLLYAFAPTGATPPTPVPAAGTHSLPRGIYAVNTTAAITVTGEHVTTENRLADKDGWPEPPPPPPVVALVPGATAESVSAFLRSIAKQLDD